MNKMAEAFFCTFSQDHCEEVRLLWTVWAGYCDRVFRNKIVVCMTLYLAHYVINSHPSKSLQAYCITIKFLMSQTLVLIMMIKINHFFVSMFKVQGLLARGRFKSSRILVKPVGS